MPQISQRLNGIQHGVKHMKFQPEKYMTLCVLSVSFFISICLGLKGMPAEMGLMIASGFVFACFLNIDKFKRFQAAGISAEMKDTIDKAVATKKELEEVTIKLGEQTKELEEMSIRLDEQLENLKEELKSTRTLAMAGIVL